MFIIGITGGTGSGKTTALHALESLGALILDCDAIYHELLDTNTGMLSEIGSRFPGAVRDGRLNRRALGEVVFSDPEALSDLNAVTHKYVRAERERRLGEWEKAGGKAAAIEAIALIENGIGAGCDVVVGVTAPRKVRLGRIMERDGITLKDAEMRIAAQQPDSFYEENCDVVLESRYDTPDGFERACAEFFTEILGHLNM